MKTIAIYGSGSSITSEYLRQAPSTNRFLLFTRESNLSDPVRKAYTNLCASHNATEVVEYADADELRNADLKLDQCHVFSTDPDERVLRHLGERGVGIVYVGSGMVTDVELGAVQPNTYSAKKAAPERLADTRCAVAPSFGTPPTATRRRPLAFPWRPTSSSLARRSPTTPFWASSSASQ